MISDYVLSISFSRDFFERPRKGLDKLAMIANFLSLFQEISLKERVRKNTCNGGNSKHNFLSLFQEISLKDNFKIEYEQHPLKGNLSISFSRDFFERHLVENSQNGTQY